MTMLSKTAALIRLAGAGSALWACQALGAADETVLMQDQPTTGTHIPRQLVVGGKLPIAKTYAELSDAHKQLVRARYRNMPPDDEPPYPRYGLVAIYKPLIKAHAKMQVTGEVEMYVTVGPDGKAQSVSVYRTPDPEVSKTLAGILMLTDYKPALCKGQPCTMEFPLAMSLMVGP